MVEALALAGVDLVGCNRAAVDRRIYDDITADVHRERRPSGDNIRESHWRRDPRARRKMAPFWQLFTKHISHVGFHESRTFTKTWR